MIGISNNKTQHSLAVAKKMKKMAESMLPPPKETCQDMFLLGYLHDIGYEFVDKPEEHAKIGGELLRSQGYKYWKEVYCHGDPNTDYSSDALTLLNIADLSVDAQGRDVGVEARLEDIKNRYGEDSKQFLEAEMLAKKIGLI